MNSSEILKYLKNPWLLNETSLPELQNMVSEYPWFRIGWILYAKNLKNLNHADYRSALGKAAIRITDRKWLKRFLENDAGAENQKRNPIEENPVISDYLVPDPATSAESQAATSEKTKLIENFLAGGATFQPLSPDGNGDGSRDLAEEAVRENDDIVTETYANLLFTQSKYNKAIEAFEKLILKFPEKSIYFAARIEEIKKLTDHK